MTVNVTFFFQENYAALARTVYFHSKTLTLALSLCLFNVFVLNVSEAKSQQHMCIAFLGK